MYIPLPSSSPLIYSLSPWLCMDCVNPPGILSHKDYFKMRWMVFMLLCLKLNRMEHAPLLKEINFVKTTYANLYEIQPVG